MFGTSQPASKSSSGAHADDFFCLSNGSSAFSAAAESFCVDLRDSASAYKN